jgi:hypothetical protein
LGNTDPLPNKKEKKEKERKKKQIRKKKRKKKGERRIISAGIRAQGHHPSSWCAR